MIIGKYNTNDKDNGLRVYISVELDVVSLEYEMKVGEYYIQNYSRRSQGCYDVTEYLTTIAISPETPAIAKMLREKASTEEILNYIAEACEAFFGYVNNNKPQDWIYSNTKEDSLFATRLGMKSDLSKTIYSEYGIDVPKDLIENLYAPTPY